MKIQYSFEEISSVSDTIKVMVNGVTTYTLNKSDCTSSGSTKAYDKLTDGTLGPYYLEDIDCNDLSTLTVTGAEGHNADYTEVDNTKWKEYAHNKIGSKHFSDSKWLSTLDSSTPIKIYNQGSDFTSDSELTSFIKSIPVSNFPSGFKLDLSNIDASSLTASTQAILLYTVCTTSAYTSIVKPYILPPNITNMVSAFQNCTSLTEVPEIPDSVTNMSYAFSGCTSLTEIPEIPSIVSYMNYAFQGCTSLTKLPKLPSGDVEMQVAFQGCTGLKDIDVLDVRTISNNYNMFLYCPIDTIKNLVLTGGNMYAFNIYSCKHLGVVTTNVLKFSSTSTYPITDKSTIFLYLRSSGSTRYTGYVFDCYPTKIDAFSSILSFVLWSDGRNNYPTSSGYNYWVDYIASDTVAVHQITQRTVSVTKHFDTLYKSGSYITDSFAPLLVAPDYVDESKENHTFELKSFTITSQTLGATTNCTSATIAVDSSDASKVKATLACTNIGDDSHSTATITAVLQYKAIIDGYDFLGETHVDISIDLDFTLDEEAKLKAKVVED